MTRTSISRHESPKQNRTHRPHSDCHADTNGNPDRQANADCDACTYSNTCAFTAISSHTARWADSATRALILVAPWSARRHTKNGECLPTDAKLGNAAKSMLWP